MKTVIIYVSHTERMSERNRLFFQYEMEQNMLYLLEYQKQDGRTWKSGEFERLWKDLERTVGVWSEWKLILADDRRPDMEVEEYLQKNIFLRNLVRDLCGGFAKAEYQGTAPEAFYILCSLGREYTTPRRKTDMILPQAWHPYVTEKSCFLFYYHETHRELPYECRHIAYLLLILYVAIYGLPVGCYRPDILYRVDADWDWKGFRRFVEQMEEQYSRMERTIWERSADTQDFFMPPVYADTYSAPRIDDSYRKRAAQWVSCIRVAREDLMYMQREFQRKAARCFRKVKQTYWRYDITDWNSNDNQMSREQYLEELRQLYETGMFDYRDTRLLADRLLESIEQNSRKRDAYTRTAVRVCLAAVIICAALSFTELIPIAALLGIVFCIICRPWTFRPEEQLMIQQEYREITDRMEGFKNRINKELSLMVDYRHEYHRYCEWKEEQERLGAANREGMHWLVDIERGRQWLKELCILLPDKAEESIDSGYSVDSLTDRECIYHPTGWKDSKEELETFGGDKVSFPYPMISCIRIDKCKKQK